MRPACICTCDTLTLVELYYSICHCSGMEEGNTKRLNETSGHGLIGCKCSQLKVQYTLKVYLKKKKKHRLNNRGEKISDIKITTCISLFFPINLLSIKQYFI